MNIQSRVGDMQVWPEFYRAPNFLVPRRKLLTPQTKIFAMGSCFALEIRNAFIRAGRAVYPDYVSVSYDKTRQIYDKIPERFGLSHFDTFSIRQEFEAAFGTWTDRAANFCAVRGAIANDMLRAEEVWQDPTRKLIYGKTWDDLKALSDRIDAAVRDGIAQSEVIVLTLGLTEVWQSKVTGRYLCMPPGAGYGGAEGQGRFHLSTFTENYENLRHVLDALFARYPEKQVVLSVSPIHLLATGSNVDVGTASLESKSILRAVAGQIAREYERVTYFPSYEMATFWRVAVFTEDGRHVLPEFANRVVGAFIGTFS